MKSKVACKPVQFQVPCKTAFYVPSIFVKSSIAYKLVTIDPSIIVESNFTCKFLSNVPNKHIKPNVPCKPIIKVTHKLSNSFVRKFARIVSDSPDPSPNGNFGNTKSGKFLAPAIVPERILS